MAINQYNANAMAQLILVAILQAITDGRDPKIISSQWQDGAKEFVALRNRYLLY